MRERRLKRRPKRQKRRERRPARATPSCRPCCVHAAAGQGRGRLSYTRRRGLAEREPPARSRVSNGGDILPGVDERAHCDQRGDRMLRGAVLMEMEKPAL
jgi:hypothetical protein